MKACNFQNPDGTPCEFDSVIECPICHKEFPVRDLKVAFGRSYSQAPKTHLRPTLYHCADCGPREFPLAYDPGTGNLVIPLLSRAKLAVKKEKPANGAP